MMWLRHTFGSAALGVTLAAYFLSLAPAAAAPRLQVNGGMVVVHSDGGTILRGQDLKGIVLRLRNGSRSPFELRFDAVEAGPFEDVELYDVAIRSQAGAAWKPLCRPGPDGRARVMAIETATSSDRSDADLLASLSLTCTAGAKGKCIMRGYRPWAANATGVPLAPYFEACVRMMRADYCGDGRSFTREGIRIESWDNLGLRTSAQSLPFESAWDSKGAVCIARARVPSIAPLATIVGRCPALAARIRNDCSDQAGRPGSDALLWNSSETGAASTPAAGR
jgi:hypothetical protein